MANSIWQVNLQVNDNLDGYSIHTVVAETAEEAINLAIEEFNPERMKEVVSEEIIGISVSDLLHGKPGEFLTT